MKIKKQTILIICGPTASGKTGLALRLAKTLPSANILSVDSRQVYHGLDIITGKDIPKNLPQTIKIYGQSFVDPQKRFNLAEFVHFADQVIQNSLDSNTPLIIVGGTGLYLKALTGQFQNIYTPPDNNLRLRLEKRPLSYLQDLLKKEDPLKFASLNRSDFMNKRRLIRAIETVRFKSKKMSLKSVRPSPTFFWIGLLPDKVTLKKNIRDRVKKRIKLGAVNEVKLFIKKYQGKNLSLFSSLGVAQTLQHIEGKITGDQLIEIWTKAEIDYARRQLVWFKKQNGIFWYDSSINRIISISKLKNILLNKK